jgi:hypothetical protein
VGAGAISRCLTRARVDVVTGGEGADDAVNNAMARSGKLRSQSRKDKGVGEQADCLLG